MALEIATVSNEDASAALAIVFPPLFVARP
jgi:hypothetical protein